MWRFTLAAGADCMEKDDSVDVGMPKEGSNWIMSPPWDMSLWQPVFSKGLAGADEGTIDW